MSARKRDRERQPHRRRLQGVPPPGGRAEDQALFQALRRALRSAEPLDLLSVVSGLVEVTDPRGRDPFDPEPQPASLDDLLESFIATPFAETTAALTVLVVMVTDDRQAERIARVLATRRHPLPAWLTGLAQARPDPDVWFLTHVLGDGDDYLFGVTLPSGDPLSALVYVDHNLGTVVKDAFIVPEPLEDLAIKIGTLVDDPDQSLTRTDPAAARAVIESAIDHGSRLYPPLDSDSWPMCRPLVEWMLRSLPAGGVAPEPKEWSDEETAAIAADFFASAIGAPLDRGDERGLLDSVLWFGTGYANGDPFRWSPVTVEMLLADWFPRKVIGPPTYLAKLPSLLRAFIRYAHDRAGIRPSLTEETLAAVDQHEPRFQRDIRSSRPQGPAALLAGLIPIPVDPYGDSLSASTSEMLLAGLDQEVGGRPALENLDDAPLPDEPFQWSGIADDIRPVVQEVLDACDRCADELLDIEHRTAMRRFLGRAAVRDPALFRRKASTARAAAAVAWVICRANDTVGSHRLELSVNDLLAWFGVKGSVSQRAEGFLRANGVDPHPLNGGTGLGTTDLLTARHRAAIIASRDRWTPEDR